MPDNSKLIEEFEKNPECKVFLSSEAGGAGLLDVGREKLRKLGRAVERRGLVPERANGDADAA